MGFWCKHDWILIAKTYVAPQPDHDEGFLDDAIMSERARSGVTTVLMVCDQCGKRSVTEMLGKEIT